MENNSNVIKFTVDAFKEHSNKLDVILEVLRCSISNDATVMRGMFKPAYGQHVLHQQLDVFVNGYITGIVMSVIDDLNGFSKQEMFVKSDFAELLDLAYKDARSYSTITLTIPYASRGVMTIVLVPVGKIWVIANLFVRHESAYSLAYVAGCEHLELDLKEMF